MKKKNPHVETDFCRILGLCFIKYCGWKTVVLHRLINLSASRDFINDPKWLVFAATSMKIPTGGLHQTKLKARFIFLTSSGYRSMLPKLSIHQICYIEKKKRE